MMEENFKKDILGVYSNDKPKLNKEEVNRWAKQTNQFLKDGGSRKRVHDPTWETIIIALLVIVIIVGIVGFLYEVDLGKFKSSINQTQVCNPEYNPEITHICNITSPECPECICNVNCSCPINPLNLTININGSG